MVEIPSIAGQRPPYILEQLARFESGERPGSDIHGPAMRETLQPADVQWPPGVRDLVAYMSQAAPDPHPDNGDGNAVALGKRLYDRRCAECHGNGSGSDSAVLPRIAGQHYHYLLARIRDFAAVHHLPADQLPLSLGNLGPAEEQAVADYLARLPADSPASR